MIAITCGNCSKQYNVDDKVAGKRVKCKACGAPIAVAAASPVGGPGARPAASPPSDEPDIFGLIESADAEAAGNELEAVAASASRGSLTAAPARGPTQMCPSCKSMAAKSSVICLGCGYNFRTGRGGHTSAEIPLQDHSDAPAPRKSRQSRLRGSELLNSIDGYLGVAIFLLAVTGLIVWCIHVVKAAPTFSVFLLVPTAITLALLLGVIAPLVMMAIQGAAYFLKFTPRGDTYTRLAMVVMLPFGMSLLCGSHVAQNPALGDTISGSWLAAIVLFVFLFRAEMLELAATCGAALVASFVGWGIVVFLSSLITLATGPLYADTLPPGPWQSLASGHSPVAPEATPPAPTPSVPTTPVAIQTPGVIPPPTPVAGNPSENDPDLFKPAPAKVETPTPPGAMPPPLPPETTVVIHGDKPPTQVATLSPGIRLPSANPIPGIAPPAPTPVPTPGVTPTTPAITPTTPADTVAKPIRSPLLLDVQADLPELQNVREVISTLTPGSWMLSVKPSDDGGVTVQRWATDPLTKRGDINFQELPKQPNSYALSPTGAHLLVLVKFPRWQLEIHTFDGKPVRKIAITDNLPPGETDAVPGIIGFTDPMHFWLRWDLNGRTVLQGYNCPSGEPYRKLLPESSFDSGTNDWAMSPDGKSLAVFNRFNGASKEVLIYDILGAIPVRRFRPMTMDFYCKGIAFSPDNRQIAIYAVAKEATTVLSFSVAKGESLQTAILPQQAQPAPKMPAIGINGERLPPEPDPRGLVWLKNGLWLVDGNEFYDPETGRKVASLGASGVIDQRSVGGSVLALVQAGPGAQGRKVTVGRLDETAVKNAVETAKKGSR